MNTRYDSVWADLLSVGLDALVPFGVTLQVCMILSVELPGRGAALVVMALRLNRSAQ